MMRRCASLAVNREIPFAGHPNVGTAFVLAMRATTPPARLKFEEGAGLVPVEILREAGRVAGAELTAPQPLRELAQFSAEQAAACLSLSAPAISGPTGIRQQVASVGLPFLMVEVGSREALRNGRGRMRRPSPATFPRRQRRGCGSGDRRAGRQTAAELRARMFHRGSSGLSAKTRPRAAPR